MVVAQESLCSGLADTAQCGTGLWRAQIKGGVITGARRHGGVLGHFWWKTWSLWGCWWEERKAGGCAPDIENIAVEAETRK